MRRTLARTVTGLLVLGATMVAGERESDACGACFHREVESESTVVNNHRMVFAISQKHTVLWDQIEYSGSPSEFAWVLPVARGTVVELSRDEWIASLDTATQPKVLSPATGGGFGDGDGVGCNPSCGSEEMDSFAGGASSSGSGPPPVQVVGQSVVGPYETVTLRSDDPQALQKWLKDHGFAFPATMEPVVAAYVGKGLDFIALRLRPNQGVRAMKPVRIVTPGADPTLPLRMVAGGAGATVGITLFVIGEGRYRPQNFPEVTIDPAKVKWNAAEGRSNYQELALATLASAPAQRGWLVEWADRAYAPIGGQNPSVERAYYSACGEPSSGFPTTQTGTSGSDPPPTPTPTFDAGADEASDAGDVDAGVDAGTTSSDGGAATSDAGTEDADASSSSPPSSNVDAPNGCVGGTACCAFDDLAVATDGMHPSDVWVTRLRADLPVAALSTDLVIEASPTQTVVSGVYYTDTGTSPTASIAPLARGRVAGSATLTTGVVLVLARLLRRRQKE